MALAPHLELLAATPASIGIATAEGVAADTINLPAEILRQVYSSGDSVS